MDAGVSAIRDVYATPRLLTNPTDARVRVAALAEGLSVYRGTGSMNGTAGDHVVIAPPFVIDDAQVNQLVDCLRRPIRRVERDLPSDV